MKIISCLFLLVSISCGKDLFIIDEKEIRDASANKRYFLSNNEDLIEKYGYFERVDLYDLIPMLNELEITIESFELIISELKNYSRIYNSNYSIIKKSDDCQARIGYCEAYILNRYVRPKW